MKRLLALYVMLFVFLMSEGANAGNPTNLVGTWSGSVNYYDAEDGYSFGNVDCNITEQQGRLFGGIFDGRKIAGAIIGKNVYMNTNQHSISGKLTLTGKKIYFVIHSKNATNAFIGTGEMSRIQ